MNDDQQMPTSFNLSGRYIYPYNCIETFKTNRISSVSSFNPVQMLLNLIYQ